MHTWQTPVHTTIHPCLHGVFFDNGHTNTTQDDDERDEGPDGEEEEDSFVVEDGYLSENEGVQPDEDIVEMSGIEWDNGSDDDEVFLYVCVCV